MQTYISNLLEVWLMRPQKATRSLEKIRYCRQFWELGRWHTAAAAAAVWGRWERGVTPTRLDTCSVMTVTAVMGNLWPCAVSEQKATPPESTRRSCGSGWVKSSPAWAEVCRVFLSGSARRYNCLRSQRGREAAAHRNTRRGQLGGSRLQFLQVSVHVYAYQNLNARFKFRPRFPRVLILGLIWSNLRQPVVKTAFALSASHSFWHQDVFFRRLQIRVWSHL